MPIPRRMTKEYVLQMTNKLHKVQLYDSAARELGVTKTTAIR